jgi:hypothetical protein
MPTYTFRDKNTGEITEKWMYMAQREPYLEANPDLEQIHLSALSAVGDPGLRDRVPEGFKDVLRKVKSHHPNATFRI